MCCGFVDIEDPELHLVQADGGLDAAVCVIVAGRPLRVVHALHGVLVRLRASRHLRNRLGMAAGPAAYGDMTVQSAPQLTLVPHSAGRG